MNTVCFISVIAGILISVPFFTLYERQLLSSIHLRQGPVLVGFWGLLQPFSDAIKLLSKESLPPHKANPSIYTLSPVSLLVISLSLWSTLPHPSMLFSNPFLILLVFLLTALSGYFHLMSSWSSNSSFSMVGGLRCVAQSISYEVSMVILFISVVIISPGFNLSLHMTTQVHTPMALPLLPLALLWGLSSLAESNRTPFDFSESESELVSGFNLEYGSSLFVLIFISEYGSMIFLSMLFSTLFFGGYGPWVPLLPGLFLILALVWVRGTYPRTRYDKLMALCWLVVLPLGLFSGFVSSSLSI